MYSLSRSGSLCFPSLLRVHLLLIHFTLLRMKAEPDRLRMPMKDVHGFCSTITPDTCEYPARLCSPQIIVSGRCSPPKKYPLSFQLPPKCKSYHLALPPFLSQPDTRRHRMTRGALLAKRSGNLERKAQTLLEKLCVEY